MKDIKAYSPEVGIRTLGHVEVEDDVHVLHVDAPRQYVCRHHETCLKLPELHEVFHSRKGLAKYRGRRMRESKR